MVPRILSSDPCLRDWDIECTYAPEYVQKIDNISFGVLILGGAVIYAMIAVIFFTLLFTAVELAAKKKGK